MRTRRFILAVVVLIGTVVGLGWLAVKAQDEVFICDTSTYGVQIELHRNALLRRQRAVVWVEPSADLRPGILPRYEIETSEEAETLGFALASPGTPRIDIFSDEFRNGNCTRR